MFESRPSGEAPTRDCAYSNANEQRSSNIKGGEGGIKGV